MARIKAPANLQEIVTRGFASALQQNELHYFPTQVTIVKAGNVPFQLRCSPSLANKPKGPPKAPSSKPFDPFENPPPALYLTPVGDAHFLVLNKFAVVPEHFILATNDFKHQTHLLDQSDLLATLACIRAYEEDRQDGRGGDGLFAFFNCGEHSGASQPHRHIQLLPVQRMKDGLGGDPGWSVLADNMDSRSQGEMPFLAFAEGISLDIEGGALHELYIKLYRRAVRAVAVYTGNRLASGAQEKPIAAEGETWISYNMAMTRDRLVICPRLREGDDVLSRDGSKLGSLALNGTVLAGTALVKSQAEWDALREDSGQLSSILRKIGIPSGRPATGS